MPYFKVREVIAKDTGNVNETAVGRTDAAEADNRLQQEAAEAAALANTGENKLLGHWAYDGDREVFIIDKTSAGFLGIEDYHQPVTADQIIARLNSFDASRFHLNMHEDSMGDIVYEHSTMTQGPCKGQSFIVQGSILKRHEDGRALYAVGFISHENSPHSELIPREISGDGMYIWDSTTDELVCSASYHAMIGYKEEEFPHYLEDFVATIVHPDDNDFFMVLSQMCLTEQYGDYFESCMRIRHKDGHYIWSICRGLVQERDATGKARRVIGTQTNINLVQSSFDNIKLMMFTDSLTGLHNRNYFMQNYRRYEESLAQPVSVIFIDISGLKLTNDILGHSHGDYLLIKARDLIREGIAKSSYSPCMAHKLSNASKTDQDSNSADLLTPATIDYLVAKENASKQDNAHGSLNSVSVTTLSTGADSSTAITTTHLSNALAAHDSTSTSEHQSKTSSSGDAYTGDDAVADNPYLIQGAVATPNLANLASDNFDPNDPNIIASNAAAAAAAAAAASASSAASASASSAASTVVADATAAAAVAAKSASTATSTAEQVSEATTAVAAAKTTSSTVTASARETDAPSKTKLAQLNNQASSRYESSSSTINDADAMAKAEAEAENISALFVGSGGYRPNSARVETLNDISKSHDHSEPMIAKSSEEASKATQQHLHSDDDASGDLMEVIRLAGDEFLVILPCCDESKVEEIASNIDKLREENNTYHEEHTAIDSRPVPIFFGIGYATYHGCMPSETTLKHVINQADELMQIDKDNRREEFYSKLKKYFEYKKGRPVSMRDERRVTILSEEEREQLRQRRLNNLMF